MRVAAAALITALALWLAMRGPSGTVLEFPAGVTEVHSEIAVDAATEVRGVPGRSVLHAADDFQGRALLVVRGDRVHIRGLVIDGNRRALEVRTGLPDSNTPFARFTRNNGVLAERVAGLQVEDVTFREIAGFAVLVSGGRGVAIESVRVLAGGSRNAAGRNNTTGGILLEEGTAGFRVEGCDLRDVRGNGIWTHSLYTSPRNGPGLFADNRFLQIGRDALQVGHATGVRVERNQGRDIGFPVDDVDVEGQGIPVAVDTAGNVDGSVYAGNIFHEIDGKCFDLDGFHDGAVRGNVCINGRGAAAYPFGQYGLVMNNSNPDMQPRNVRIEDNRIVGAKLGGIFVIGTDNVVTGNALLDLNTAHYGAGQPALWRAGIYLGSGGARPAPARGNVIERNRISGWDMAGHCVTSDPQVRPEWNTVRFNRCE